MVLLTGISQSCSIPSTNAVCPPHLALTLGSWDPLPQLQSIWQLLVKAKHSESPAIPPRLISKLFPQGIKKRAMSALFLHLMHFIGWVLYVCYVLAS